MDGGVERDGDEEEEEDQREEVTKRRRKVARRRPRNWTGRRGTIFRKEEAKRGIVSRGEWG